MNKSESRYFNTAVRMDEAMLQLLEKKDFEYITVKEICETAKVNRSTFYLHYENTRDLLTESIQYMNGQFLTYFDAADDKVVEKMAERKKEELILIKPEYLMPYLSYIKEHRRLFQTALAKANAMNLEDTYHKMFQHIFRPIMEKFQIPDEEKGYLAAFYINGIMAIIREWLKSDCVLPAEQISSMIIKCILPSGWEKENYI